MKLQRVGHPDSSSDSSPGDVGWEAVAFNVPVAEFHTARSLARSGQVPKLGPDILADGFSVEGGVERLVAYVAEHPEAEVGVVLLKSAGAGWVGECL